MDVRALAEGFRRYGMRSTAHRLALRALKRVVPYRALYGVQIGLSQLARSEYLTQELPYQCRFLSPDEVLGQAVREPTLATEFVREALARGDRCYGILDGDVLAAYGWYASAPTQAFDGLYLHFDPAYVYMYKGFTHPNYRGQRLHGIGMARALAAVTAQGSRGFVSYIETDNVRSLRSCERMGYRRFGVVRVIGRGASAWIHTSNGCADFRFTLSPQAPALAGTEPRHRAA